MTTLQDLVVAKKCRKGPAVGTTKRGAFWLACKPITLRRAGGDGIGQSPGDVTYTLSLRHYRNGTVQPSIRRWYWHQNGGEVNRYETCDSLLKCKTAEQVICDLKGTRFVLDEYSGYDDHVFSDFYTDELTAALVALGMPIAEPAPDES